MRTLTRSLPALTAAPLLLALLLPAAPAGAAPCDRLDAAQRKMVQKLLGEVYPYDCCDEILAKCLKQKKVCKLARRLRDDICRRAARGQEAKAIKNAMDRRARSMTPTRKKAAMDLSRAEVAGTKDAKVQVVVYACARCPFCSKVVPDLYRKVTSGGLKGKAALYMRPFPIRGHEGAAEGGMAMMAAQEQGKFWPYIMKLYANYDDFSVANLGKWADDVGLDQAKFSKAVTDAALRQRLVRSKKEGLRNGVTATPTLYINGRQYHGDMDPETLLDVLDEEADRVAGQTHCDAKGKTTFK